MSFEKKKQKNFEIDVDYQSTFADGVIISPEDNDTVKMIFYENTYKFDPKGGLDKDSKISRLKFEVKLSSYTLEKLSSHIFNVIMPNMVVDFVKIKQMHRLKKSTINEINKLSDNVVGRTFDTDNPVRNEDLEDLHRSIMDRMFRDEEDGKHNKVS